MSDQVVIKGNSIISARKLGSIARDNPTYKIIRKVVIPKLKKLGITEIYMVPAPLPFAKDYKPYVMDYIHAVHGVLYNDFHIAFIIYTNADGTVLAPDNIKVDFGFFKSSAFKNSVIKVFTDAFGGYYKWSGDIQKYMTIKYGSLNKSKSPANKSLVAKKVVSKSPVKKAIKKVVSLSPPSSAKSSPTKSPSKSPSKKSGRCSKLGRKMKKNEFYCLTCCNAVKSTSSPIIKQVRIKNGRLVTYISGICIKGHNLRKIIKNEQ